MCLIVDNQFKTRKEARGFKPLKAKENILVYKKLYEECGKYFSPYRNKEYKMGKKYSANLGRKVVINFGDRSWDETQWEIRVNQGLHSYIIGFSIFCGIIPRGSLYYVGDNNDIVSNTLVVFQNMVDLRKRYKTYRKLLTD